MLFKQGDRIAELEAENARLRSALADEVLIGASSVYCVQPDGPPHPAKITLAVGPRTPPASTSTPLPVAAVRGGNGRPR